MKTQVNGVSAGALRQHGTTGLEVPEFELRLGVPVTLSDGRELRLVSVEAETSRPSPGAPERAGANVRLTLGGWPMDVAWFADGMRARSVWRADVELEVLGVSDDVRAVTVRVTRWDIPESGPTLGPYRLDLNQQVATAEGLSATFLRHSHKSMDPSARGPGPLGVTIRYEAEGDTEVYSTWVELEDKPRWTWRKWFFTLESHEYDKSSTIRVGNCVPHALTNR